GYAGLIWRGNPDGYKLTNGFRWGAGAIFPLKFTGLRVHGELFGEADNNSLITAPSGIQGSDGSFVPVNTHIKSPVFGSIGLTWQAPKGFFVGASWSWNLNMSGRGDATPGCPPEVL